MKKILFGAVGGVIVVSLGVAVYFSFTHQNTEQGVCTMEVKLCPDGSSVARSGSRCEFAPCPMPKKVPPMKRTDAPAAPDATKKNNTPAPVPVEYIDDSVSTLSNPMTILASDGKHSFTFGQPKGQNSKKVKKIIFSLPGHGSTSAEDYAAWQSHITKSDYALASVNWWDGEGEKTSDYYTPEEVASEIRVFLSRYGYTSTDFIVLEGFSRGSANTYAVKAYDISKESPVIDAVISASGKYQGDFAMTPELLRMNGGKIFQDVPWILACGAKDPNPTRDGCEGMNETKTFLTGAGALVLGLLEDPNGTHGAFHRSSLDLVAKAFKLLDGLPESK